MKKLTIGLICPYSFLFSGGVQEHIKNLGTALKKLNCNVIYFSPDKANNSLPQEHISTGRNFRIPTPNGSWAEISFSQHGPSQIRRLINDHEIDILHFQELLSPFTSWAWLNASNIPNIATFHAAWDKNPYINIFLKLIAPMIKNKIIKSISSSSVSALSNRSLLTKNIVIPPTINLHLILSKHPYPSSFNKSAINVLFVGRLDRRKGALYLIKSLQYLSKNNNVLLHIIGEGPEKSRLIDLICKHDLSSQIIFYGKVNNLTKYAFLQHANLFVAPTTHGESFGMVLVEALAAGCPVIAGNNDGYKETLKDYPYQQYVVDPTNSEALASAITSLVSNKSHQKYIKRWAKKWVKQFDANLIANKHLKLYRQILSQ